ncbi:MAG: hypothetical protein MI723_13115, partial [Caulobacterales bacterium]|nr:hypothetical protein [Caulobacterales bacterium]
MRSFIALTPGRLARRALAMLAAVIAASPALATEFYIDPDNGTAGGDGSQAAPWRTLEEVVTFGLIETQEFSGPGSNTLVTKNPGAPVGGGDTLIL